MPDCCHQSVGSTYRHLCGNLPLWVAPYEGSILVQLLCCSRCTKLVRLVDGRGLVQEQHNAQRVAVLRGAEERRPAVLVRLVDGLCAAGGVRALLLECTNLPPYKQALKARFDIEIFDILTLIDSMKADIVNPAHL